ncbi:hypothetical protein [Piscinibacter sakaiensis]|nr:hypothetical protein [Piscinibacter sakaiensis]
MSLLRNPSASSPSFPWPGPPRRLAATAGAVLLALGAVVAGAARAADPPPAKPAPKPAARPAAKAPAPAAPAKARDPLLTREQLAACMARQERVRQQGDEARQLQGALEREKTELLQEGEALKAALSTLDRSDVASVDAYNARAAARDQRIDAFEPRVKAFNAQAEALQAERAGYSRDCENRRFDEKDEKALQGGR